MRACELIFGEKDASRTDWCEFWTVEKYLKDQIPFENALSICCGFGEVDRSLARLGVAGKFTGTDIAAGAIEKAREKARRENLDIEYFVADLNNERFEANQYDLIFANGALHHIEALDTLVPRLFEALKPGGYLISNEYVGPKYQKIGPRQQEIVNAARHLLPHDLRSDSLNYYPMPFWRKVKNAVTDFFFAESRRTFGRLYQYNAQYFEKLDPSESVSSDRVIPALRRQFKNVTVKPFGGSVLFYALDSTFYQNFDPANKVHSEALDLLFKLEDAYLDSGELQSDHAHIICQREY
ncbi:MAG: class I SAM-dependent methyltransferase [Gemmatimonadaceae bacterium]|nr:class I SAM-dependent methyltransferase [Gemmatimonadaceae bacterium]